MRPGKIESVWWRFWIVWHWEMVRFEKRNGTDAWRPVYRPSARISFTHRSKTNRLRCSPFIKENTCEPTLEKHFGEHRLFRGSSTGWPKVECLRLVQRAFRSDYSSTTLTANLLSEISMNLVGVKGKVCRNIIVTYSLYGGLCHHYCTQAPEIHG